MGENTRRRQRLEECATDTAKLMTALLLKYKRDPGVLAQCLTDSLGCFVALTSDTPQKSLENIADRLRMVDHVQIRTRHFGWRLGVINGGKDKDDSIDGNGTDGPDGKRSPGPDSGRPAESSSAEKNDTAT